MARTLRRLTPPWAALPLALLWAAPLILSLVMLLPALGDGEAWRMLFRHPQLWPALGLSLFTGIVSTLLALTASLLILAGLYRSPAWNRLPSYAAAGLAIPHLAFAIGFGFLIMPSGLLARVIVGGGSPPGWVTVQDPLGLTLIAALALKEMPFLVTAAVATLTRGDAASRLLQECRAAASLGHGQGSAFLRIVLPQLMRGLRWPLVIVFVYGATVVDMALVLGPALPPTLGVFIWEALNNAEPAKNMMAMSAALLLTAVLALVTGLAGLCLRLSRAAWRSIFTAGPSTQTAPRVMAEGLGLLALAILAVTVVLLGLLSLTPRWPYPAILPPALDASAWSTLAASPEPVWLSLLLSVLVSAAAVVLAVLWFESQAPERDRYVIALALLALALPQLATAGGQYRLFLESNLTGTLAGLFLAHLTPVAAYVLIVLQGPYRAFDDRYVTAARALSASPARSFLKVKLPLLKVPLLTAAAIGFAVSIAQFVPAQLIAAGRYSTLTMEAVTLSSGGNRPLTAAFALVLALPPLLAFLLAARLGRPRWR